MFCQMNVRYEISNSIIYLTEDLQLDFLGTENLKMLEMILCEMMVIAFN